MLEARLQSASVLKRLLDAIKELVTDANFECNEEGLALQAMDNSHVALVAVNLDAAGFDMYRCDRPMPLGVNLNSLTKVLKCAKDDDMVTLKATDNGDTLNLIYEAKNSDRVAEYDMKLMDIDTDALGIPDTDYEACVTMSATEFSRIIRDLAQLSESVRIDVSKEGVRFASDGEAANAVVLLKQTDSARRRFADWGVKKEKEEGEDQKNGSSKSKVKKEKIKKEENEEGENEDEGGDDAEEENGKADSDKNSDGEAEKGDEENEEEEEEEESSNKKKRKRSTASKDKKGSKRAKKSEDDDSGDSGGVAIQMSQAVSLTFSLKYLVNFTKGGSLVDVVQLKMHSEVPLLVAYHFGQGAIQYYLAPKIGDE